MANTWICPYCFSEEKGPLEFTDEAKYRAHMEEHKKAPRVEPAKKEPEPKPKPKPIELVYKYEGDCEVCGSSIDTIPLDTAEKGSSKLIIVGWCPRCREKKAQKEVAKL